VIFIDAGRIASPVGENNIRAGGAKIKINAIAAGNFAKEFFSRKSVGPLARNIQGQSLSRAKKRGFGPARTGHNQKRCRKQSDNYYRDNQLNESETLILHPVRSLSLYN
jgi:3-deoxy-D-arabino-heptulosonate 7-phosphate (DAHP) synthase